VVSHIDSDVARADLAACGVWEGAVAASAVVADVFFFVHASVSVGEGMLTRGVLTRGVLTRGVHADHGRAC
jgi:hypothetical protein